MRLTEKVIPHLRTELDMDDEVFIADYNDTVAAELGRARSYKMGEQKKAAYGKLSLC